MPGQGVPGYGDPMNGVGQGPRPGGFGPKPGGGGGGQQHQGYGPDATYKMLGGQMTVGSKGGGRSWLGAPETEEGSLVPMGMGDNGFMQHGRVPIGNYTNIDPNSQGTPFARPGSERAGFADDFGWNAVGGANKNAWQGMFGTGGYQTYGQPTGVFADVGIQAQGSTPYPGQTRPRRTRTFGQVM